ncbi:unnamed protein product [Moneuplotes crassus]|uniref:Uncharacterized protein n=1 Tax=Euplotes crassus TaxID=5936 RepID=A0AAD1Y7V2_EUPCR|nr:unnamed protein product [Moneuplotes crassus]
MSFEGFRDLDSMIREEISSIDKIATTARENSATKKSNIKKYEECDIFYPNEKGIMNSFKPLPDQSHDSLHQYSGSNNIDLTPDGDKFYESRSSNTVEVKVKADISRQDRTRSHLKKDSKEPLKEIQNISGGNKAQVDLIFRVYKGVTPRKLKTLMTLKKRMRMRSMTILTELIIQKTLIKSSQHSVISKKSKDYDRLKGKTDSNSGSYHFIGSSFGKNSIPGLKEFVEQRQKTQKEESVIYENKVSEEVKLNATLQYSQEFLSSEKSFMQLENQNSIKTDLRLDGKSTIKNVMSKLQENYYRSDSFKEFLDSKAKEVKISQECDSKFLQTLYSEFKTLNHKDIFNFIMETREEISKLKEENMTQKHEISRITTENVMLKKYCSGNSPLKFSKDKFEALQKKYDKLKIESDNIQKRMNNSLLQSNEVITTLLTEIHKGANNSMMSLHNLIFSLENKISVLVKKSQGENKVNSHGLYSPYNPGSSQIFDADNVGEYQIKNSSNALQDTHVFLKQAMDSIDKSTQNKTTELLEPESEDAQSNLMGHHNPNQFKTCDTNFNLPRKIDENYCPETFDYRKRKKALKSRKVSKDTSKSPRIHMNAKNVKNKYKIQAEKFSSKAQRKTQGSSYTQRGISPNVEHGYHSFNIKNSQFSIHGEGSYSNKVDSKHNRNKNKSISSFVGAQDESVTSRMTASEMKRSKQSKVYSSKIAENAYNSNPQAQPKTHRKSKSNTSSATRKDSYTACDGTNKYVPPNYSTLYKQGKNGINYHELLQKMILERKKNNVNAPFI